MDMNESLRSGKKGRRRSPCGPGSADATSRFRCKTCQPWPAEGSPPLRGGLPSAGHQRSRWVLPGRGRSKAEMTGHGGRNVEKHLLFTHLIGVQVALEDPAQDVQVLAFPPV